MTSGELRIALLNGEITFSEVAEALTDAMEHYADSRAEVATDSMWTELEQDESLELRECGKWDADIQLLREAAKSWGMSYANEFDEQVSAIETKKAEEDK